MIPVISEEQYQQFQENGYFVLENVFSLEEVEELNQHYTPTVFAPVAMASTSEASLIPEDILYIVPTLTVYERK